MSKIITIKDLRSLQFSSDTSEEDIIKAMEESVERGLFIKIELSDGSTAYETTMLGDAFSKNENSDPKTRN